MEELKEALIELNWIKSSHTIHPTFYKRMYMTTPFKFDILYKIIYKNGNYYIYTVNEYNSQKFGKYIYDTKITSIEEYFIYFSYDIDDNRKFKLKIATDIK